MISSRKCGSRKATSLTTSVKPKCVVNVRVVDDMMKVWEGEGQDEQMQ